MSVKPSDFLPFVLPDVEGCPRPLAEQAIMQACIRFCEESKYWRYTDEGIVLSSNIKEYEIDTGDSYSQIATIFDPIKYNGKKVYQKTRSYLDQNDPKWESKTGTDADHFVVVKQGVIRPVPYPDQSGTMSVNVALKPLPTASTLPDFLLNEFYQVIAYGALHYLMDKPGKDWSNPEMALYYEGKFQQAIDDAESKARADYKTEDTINRSKAHFF